MVFLQIIILQFIALVQSEPKPGKKETNYMVYRSRAFEAYADQKWEITSKLLKSAIDNYAFRQRALSFCIQRCSDEDIKSETKPLLEVSSMTEYLSMLGCVERCCLEKLGDPLIIDDPLIDEIFRNNQYYSILQQTHQMSGNMEGSIQAGETFFLFNPSNVAMYQRLGKLYKETRLDRQGPLQEPLYHEQYNAAVQSYQEKDWPKCSYLLEQSIATYLRLLDLCRARCTYPYDKTSALKKVLDLSGAVVEVTRQIGECRLNCFSELPLRSNSESGYLAGMLEYLQYCQYMVGQYQHSASSCYSFQLLDSRNTLINDNIAVYRGIDDINLTPRKDIVEFLSAYKKDIELVNQGDERTDPHVFLSERDYYAASGILSSEQCTAFVNLIKEHGIENDGYEDYDQKQSSPFTDAEKFYGLELEAVWELLEDDQIEIGLAQLFLDAISAAKDHVERQFKLPRPLYFDYVHLVRRSAIPDLSNTGVPAREPFSHPIHGDNCILDHEDGSCVKEEPAYTHRDWSALLYVQPPKEGGEFVIVDDQFEELASVVPECGVLTGFTGDTYHGVKSVTRGHRVAIGLWFTHDISKAMDMEWFQRRLENVAVQQEEPIREEL